MHTPFPDPMPYPSAPYYKFLYPPLVEKRIFFLPPPLNLRVENVPHALDR